VRPGGSFDALFWFNYLAFDILLDLVFGERIDMIEGYVVRRLIT
jgi:benzoate 4-monooxygenase